MEQIVHSLGGLIVQALPTFLLVFVLHFYIRRTFFRPMQDVMQARYEATEGARKLAEEGMKRADQKTTEYEAAINAARSEIYREQEEIRKQWREEHDASLHDARVKAEAMVSEAKEDLRAEAEAARQSLRADSEALADQIARAILQRRAS